MSQAVITTADKKKLWKRAVDLWAEGKITGQDLACLHKMFYRKKVK